MSINEQEARMAKRDGGKAVKNSGRGMNKGDAQVGDLLVDYKFTDRASFSLNINAFKKHERDADKIYKRPVVVVVFQEQNRRIAMVDYNYLLELERDEGYEV